MDEVLTLACDVLIPAATSHVITTEVVPALNCKYIVEAANCPVTPEADFMLRQRGIPVVPDIYAAGGVRTAPFPSLGFPTRFKRNIGMRRHCI